MIARECDRCGSFYIPNDDMRTYIVSKKSLVGIQIDLCPECHDDLLARIEFTLNSTDNPIIYKSMMITLESTNDQNQDPQNVQ